MSETSGPLGLQVALATGSVVMLQRPKGLLVRGMQEGGHHVSSGPGRLGRLAMSGSGPKTVIVWLRKNELGLEVAPAGSLAC